MNILLIEPYYTGSHKMWANGYRKHSNHNIELITLEGRHWKWRMHGGSIELASLINERYNSQAPPDMMLISDMLDLTTFKCLLRSDLTKIPMALYFHENQLSYPYTDADTDSKRMRDFHYGFINYTSALVADRVFFNSHSQMNAFFGALSDLLGRMPDHKGLDTIQDLKDKTSVLPLGIEYSDPAMNLSTFKALTNRNCPTVLWTHRWEYDKNPDDFFDAMFKLSDAGYEFNLAVLGAKSPKPPKIFKTARERLKDQIVAFGKPETFEQYIGWLKCSDILPITSMHETFGISLMEAMHHGVTPLLPKRLSYPELVPYADYGDLFYNDHSEMIEKLKAFMDTYSAENKLNFRHLTSKYDWSTMGKIYDTELSKIVDASYK